MNAGKWNTELDAAFTEGEVLFTVHAFLAERPPEELLALPVNCRPRELHDAADVADLAYMLASSQCARVGLGAPNDLLSAMCDFFAHACRRLALIAAHRAAHGVSIEFHESLSRG